MTPKHTSEHHYSTQMTCTVYVTETQTFAFQFDNEEDARWAVDNGELPSYSDAEIVESEILDVEICPDER